MNNHYPYVVSEDIHILLKEWADNRGFTLPNDDFFHSLRQEFISSMKAIFPGFEFVTASELTSGITKLIEQVDLLPISLDRVYCRTSLSIEVTRSVDKSGNSMGLRERPRCLPLNQQFQLLEDELSKLNVKEVVLIDDVIFTGGMINEVIGRLVSRGIRVPHVCAGIGTAEGIARINTDGRGVHCIRTYAQIIDQVCERDFYPGIPFSGRTVVGRDDDMGMPYLLPFGSPLDWASIPDRLQVTFSEFCLEQTIKLFREIEARSSKIVLGSDLTRRVFGLPLEKRFIDELQQRAFVLDLVDRDRH